MRLIDSTKLIDALPIVAEDKKISLMGAVADMVMLISEQPVIEAEPVRHGRWGTHSDRPDSLICSVCKCGFDMWKHDPHNYCPNCGAKMDGDSHD